MENRSRKQYHVVVPATWFISDIEKGTVETQVLYGEQINVTGRVGDYLACTFSHYSTPGYVLASHVREHEFSVRQPRATHWVCVPKSIVYRTSTFKAPRLDDFCLYMNSQVRVIGGANTPEGHMCQLDVGWVFTDQLRKKGFHYIDHVDAALLYVGTPYAWGGRAEPDCSGLVQQSLLAAGMHNPPRNCGEQIKHLGEDAEIDVTRSGYSRGDFVFWNEIPGKSRHVAVMVGETSCVNASIAKPRVIREEPLEKVIDDQLRDGNGKPTAVRRLQGFR